jgi:hypothetical protein
VRYNAYVTSRAHAIIVKRYMYALLYNTPALAILRYCLILMLLILVDGIRTIKSFKNFLHTFDNLRDLKI